MSAGPSAGSSGSRQPSGGYFASLTSAKYMLLTTLSRDDTLVSTAVHPVTDGHRVYFWHWCPSKTWHRLRYTDWVQVAPCTALGFCGYGPLLDATARPLDGEEARLASRMLAQKYRLQHGFLIPLMHRIRGRQTVPFDLRPDEDAQLPGEPPA